MAVEYNNSDKFKALAHILEDYTEWFSRISLCVSYPDEESLPKDFSMPTSFVDWLESDDVSKEIPVSVMQPVVDIHVAMQEVGTSLIESVRDDRKPKYKEFIELRNLWSSFLATIRRLERDSAMDIDSVDEGTGLRSPLAVDKDLQREMGRLARNGTPLALSLVRIDGFQNYDDESVIVPVTVSNIKKSLRPFDDAYYLENGQFLLSLKHTDMAGADAVIARIQRSLSVDSDNTRKVTISSCVSEPVPGDNMPELLENMKKDLHNHSDSKGAILKFLEMSPLERFVGSIG